MGQFLDTVLNLPFLTGRRTTVIGAAIVLLNLYQALAAKTALPAFDPAALTVLQALLIERLAKFAKEHRAGSG